MIGVLAKASQTAVVEEFFELFKTPWEFYEPGKSYDVLVTTTGDIPESGASLIVVSSPRASIADERYGITQGSAFRGASLRWGGTQVPIYGELLTFAPESAGVHCLEATCGIAGVRLLSDDCMVLRVGYDVFDEAGLLLAAGQPVHNAHLPTLDLHIAMLRNWILESGLSLVEVPPIPATGPFCVCLTHDIDFVGIRRHLFDHSMWGFLYRSTIGAIRSFFRRRISLGRLGAMWRAAVSLPFVYAGWIRDFWEPFDWYSRVERGLPATYFLIPFKRRAGHRVAGTAAARRATAYDITDVPEATASLMKRGCEIGVHGIDAWHSIDSAREELARITDATGRSGAGVRMHWLLQDEDTCRVLDAAGFAYDSTAGYNETVGYRNGTTQVFRPIGVRSLLELPLHIQDGALFYPRQLDLSEPEAAQRCDVLIANARRYGGVLTVLWHDRSHGPERFWGPFYMRLIETLREASPWFGSGAEVAGWFRQRRAIRFERDDRLEGPRVSVHYEGREIEPPVVLRTHRPSLGGHSSTFVDCPWNGQSDLGLEPNVRGGDSRERGVAPTCVVQ